MRSQHCQRFDYVCVVAVVVYGMMFVPGVSAGNASDLSLGTKDAGAALNAAALKAAAALRTAATAREGASRRRGAVPPFSADNQCDVFMDSLHVLADHFPCIREYCSKETSGRASGHARKSSAKSAPVSVHAGTYITSNDAYKRHYMGLSRMSDLNTRVNPAAATNDSVFYPFHLQSFATMLTHIYYGFWEVTALCDVEETNRDAAWNQDHDCADMPVPPGACKGLLNDLKAVKTTFGHLNLAISIGGWSHSRHFSRCIASEHGRNRMYKTFAYRLNEIDNYWGTDRAVWNGVEFHWEFPASNASLYPTSNATDWKNLVSLIELFRTRAAKERRKALNVSVAVSVGDSFTQLVKDRQTTRNLCRVASHINLMSYTFHDKSSKSTGHNANFCQYFSPTGNASSNAVMDVVVAFIAAGCPAAKINLGIPTFSNTWTRVSTGPFGSGLFTVAEEPQNLGWSTYSEQNDVLSSYGVVSYWDLVENVLSEPDFDVYTVMCEDSDEVAVPIRHLYSAQRKVFATYEDIDTVAHKILWAKKKGLGGYFFSAARHDKYGDLVRVAHNSWGATQHHSQRWHFCVYHTTPNFNIDPYTGRYHPLRCRRANRVIKAGAGATCSRLRSETERICNGLTQVVGGFRPSQGVECINMCSPAWNTLEFERLEQGDYVYYICNGEETET